MLFSSLAFLCALPVRSLQIWSRNIWGFNVEEWNPSKTEDAEHLWTLWSPTFLHPSWSYGVCNWAKHPLHTKKNCWAFHAHHLWWHLNKHLSKFCMCRFTQWLYEVNNTVVSYSVSRGLRELVAVQGTVKKHSLTTPPRSLSLVFQDSSSVVFGACPCAQS